MAETIKTARDIHGVTSPEEWRTAALEFGARTNAFTELTVRNVEVLAFVNSNKWVVVCPWCNNAPAVEPDWLLALCYECGSEYAPALPEATQLPQIEALLVERPRAARNWDPSEPLDQLASENLAYSETAAGGPTDGVDDT